MELSKQENAGFVIRALRQLVHGLRVTAHSVERDFGLSGAQLFVLREISDSPGVSIRELSARTLTDPSSASVVVARLFDKGLISKKRSQLDARRTVLHATAQGRKILNNAPAPYQARLFDALQELTGQQLHQLRGGLEALMSQSRTSADAQPLFFEEQGAPLENDCDE